MNTIKTYVIANRKKGQVIFGSQHGGKWIFKAAKWMKITKVPGGQKVAEKIAEAIHKSLLRTAGKPVEDDSQRIDGTCRNIMNCLLKVRTLADYKDEPEWWSNPFKTPRKIVELPEGISAEDLEIDTEVEPATEPAVEVVG